MGSEKLDLSVLVGLNLLISNIGLVFKDGNETTLLHKGGGFLEQVSNNILAPCLSSDATIWCVFGRSGRQSPS